MVSLRTHILHLAHTGNLDAKIIRFYWISLAIFFIIFSHSGLCNCLLIQFFFRLCLHFDQIFGSLSFLVDELRWLGRCFRFLVIVCGSFLHHRLLIRRHLLFTRSILLLILCSIVIISAKEFAKIVVLFLFEFEVHAAEVEASTTTAEIVVIVILLLVFRFYVFDAHIGIKKIGRRWKSHSIKVFKFIACDLRGEFRIFLVHF